jgi:hypothetical protein
MLAYRFEIVRQKHLRLDNNGVLPYDGREKRFSILVFESNKSVIPFTMDHVVNSVPRAIFVQLRLTDGGSDYASL